MRFSTPLVVNAPGAIVGEDRVLFFSGPNGVISVRQAPERSHILENQKVYLSTAQNVHTLQYSIFSSWILTLILVTFVVSPLGTTELLRAVSDRDRRCQKILNRWISLGFQQFGLYFFRFDIVTSITESFSEMGVVSKLSFGEVNLAV